MKPVIDSLSHKWCASCKASKPIIDFSKNHRNRLGIDTYCKECTSKKMKKHIPIRLRKRQETKAKLILEFGNKCFDCKSFDLPICSFVFHHHSETMGNKEYRSPSSVITYQQADVILKEKKKWILLCSNCHNFRHSICKLSATKFEL